MISSPLFSMTSFAASLPFVMLIQDFFAGDDFSLKESSKLTYIGVLNLIS